MAGNVAKGNEATSNLQALVNTKAALDLGLVTQEDYDAVKVSFLEAQKLRSTIDAGLVQEGEVERVKKDFLSSLLLRSAGTNDDIANVARGGSIAGGSSLRDSGEKQISSRKPAPSPAAPQPPRAPPVPPPIPSAPISGALDARKDDTGKGSNGGPTLVPKNIPSLGGTRASQIGGVSMSGISLSSDAVNIFYLIRSKSKYRWVLWKVNDEATEVVIDSVGDPSSTYQDFLDALPQNDCRYGVYDYEFVAQDGQTHSKIVFINWAPDTAKVKSKMMYASTKDFFKSRLEGLSVEFQGSDYDEISDEEVGNAVKALKKAY
eukprot:jgi/Picsp_1/5121/NSC_02484-R1_actin-depolymerizing factor